MKNDNAITRIYLFPDYSSTGIWVAYEGTNHPYFSIDVTSLPFKLNDQVKSIIVSMNDVFEDTNIWRVGLSRTVDGNVVEKQYKYTEMDRVKDNALLAKAREYKLLAEKAFAEFHPEYAHLLDTTPCNYLEDITPDEVD